MENQVFNSEEKEERKAFQKSSKESYSGKPTGAFVSASWVVLLTGMVSYCVGLWNATMWLNEKGYYFAILLFGLFSVISVQKNVRDKQEGQIGRAHV